MHELKAGSEPVSQRVTLAKTEFGLSQRFGDLGRGTASRRVTGSCYNNKVVTSYRNRSGDGRLYNRVAITRNSNWQEATVAVT